MEIVENQTPEELQAAAEAEIEQEAAEITADAASTTVESTPEPEALPVIPEHSRVIVFTDGISPEEKLVYLKD